MHPISLQLYLSSTPDLRSVYDQLLSFTVLQYTISTCHHFSSLLVVWIHS